MHSYKTLLEAILQQTLWEDILMLGSDLTGERSGPPPRLAVEGQSSGHGPMLSISDVTYVKSMCETHGRGPRLALQNRAAALTTPST